MTLTLGSLCTGYGGLDLAAHDLWDCDLTYVSDIDKPASRVLATRFPEVPNLGDLTTADFPPVDILTAGFPCQPVSHAGARRGVEDDHWLWDDLLDAVRRMDTPPRLLLFENVLGLLTANGGEAMARVVEGLGASGFMGSWRTVRASQVGACHSRARVFIVAHRGDPPPLRWTRPAGPPATHPQDGPRQLPVGGEEPEPGGPDPVVEWGPHTGAVQRHARAFGRPPPPPLVGGRLSPPFVEWMMGLPPGWVTDVAGLSLSAQLRILGNGVVPRQAVHAWRLLLEER